MFVVIRMANEQITNSVSAVHRSEREDGCKGNASLGNQQKKCCFFAENIPFLQFPKNFYAGNCQSPAWKLTVTSLETDSFQARDCFLSPVSFHHVLLVVGEQQCGHGQGDDHAQHAEQRAPDA